MRINDSPPPVWLESLKALARANTQEANPVNANEKEEDTVTVRSTPTSSDREAKVAELRRQYLDGAYTVDPAKVSAKIVDEHIEK